MGMDSEIAGGLERSMPPDCKTRDCEDYWTAQWPSVTPILALEPP